MWWLFPVAFAAPPTAYVGDLDQTGEAVQGFVAQADLVSWYSGTKAYVLDVNRWSVSSYSPGCTVNSVALSQNSSTDAVFFVGCDNGDLVRLNWTPESILLSASPNTWTFSLGSVRAMWFGQSGQLYPLVREDVSGVQQLRLHQLDASDQLDTGSAYPALLSSTADYSAGAVAGDTLMLTLGGSQAANVSLSSGLVSFNSSALQGITPVDITASTNTDVLVMTSDGRIMKVAVLGFLQSQFLGSYEQPLGTLVALSTSADWLMFATDVGLEMFELSFGLPVDQERDGFIDLSESVSDVLVFDQGYGLFGTDSGTVGLMSSRPWIDDFAVSPIRVGTDESVQFSFTAPSGGAWALYRGGDRTGSGLLINEGVVDAAGLVQVELLIDQSWPESTSDVFLVFQSGNDIGHQYVALTVDNPPAAVVLGQSSLGFGDQRLVLTFDALSAQDISSYTVYLSDVPFYSGEYPTGGPSFSSELLTGPISTDYMGGATVEVILSPLLNEETYYLAVRAVDASGEGPMSDVISGTPRATFSASDLAGEHNAPLWCATGGGFGGLSFFTFAGLVALLRRRAASVLIMCLAVGTANDAFALDFTLKKDKNGEWVESADRDKVKADMELVWTSMAFPLAQDGTTATPMGLSYPDAMHPGVYVQGGRQLWGLLEFDLGVGRYKTKGTTASLNGQPSTDVSALTWMPFNASASLRLQLIDEQPIVPYVSYSLDYLVWRETWGTSGKNQGAFSGNHVSYGINILLDVFEPARASRLEAQSGIEDSYLTISWDKRQTYKRVKSNPDPLGDGFNFVADSFKVGLKLDF